MKQSLGFISTIQQGSTTSWIRQDPKPWPEDDWDFSKLGGMHHLQKSPMKKGVMALERWNQDNTKEVPGEDISHQKKNPAGDRTPQAGPKAYQPAPDITVNSPHLLLLFGERFPCLIFVYKVLVDLPEVTLVQVLDYLLLLRGHLLREG